MNWSSSKARRSSLGASLLLYSSLVAIILSSFVYSGAHSNSSNPALPLPITQSVSNRGDATVSVVTATSPSITVPSGIVSYVPVEISNDQLIATSAPFQVLVNVSSVSFASLEASNLDNVEFFYSNGTIIPSWLESGNTSTAQSTIYWLDLADGISANSSITVYMGFASPLMNLLNNQTTGEAPQLSPEYGQYDNGGRLFLYYQNFTGTTCPLEWICASRGSGAYSISNGATETGFPDSYSFSSVVTTRSFSPTNASVADAFASIHDAGGGANIVGYVDCAAQDSGNLNGLPSGCAGDHLVGWGLLDTNIGNCQSTGIFPGSYPGYYPGTCGMPIQALEGKETVYSTWWKSSSNADFYYDYSNRQHLSSLGQTSPIQIGIVTGSGTTLTQWLRFRSAPPNGVMPTSILLGPVNIGLLGQYWSNNSFPLTPPDHVQIDANITFATTYGYNWHPFGYGSFSVKWNGTLTAPTNGTYSFQLNSDDGSLLYVDGALVINNGGAHPPQVVGGSADLIGGSHAIYVAFFECCGGQSGVDLSWMPPGTTGFVPVPSCAFGGGCALSNVFDFKMTATPTTITVLRGAVASYDLNIVKLAGTSQPVTLMVTGLPNGATVTLLTALVGDNTIGIQTSLGGGLGDYNLTITGQSASISHSITVGLHIYDFTVTSSQCEQTVLRGSIAPFDLTTALVSGSSTFNLPPLTIRASGLPSDATFSPTQVTLSSNPVTVSVLIQTGNTSLGDFPFSITIADTRASEGGMRSVLNCSGGAQGNFTARLFYPIIVYSCSTEITTSGILTCTINYSLAPGSSTTNLPDVQWKFVGSNITFNPVCPATLPPPTAITCTITFSNPPAGSFSITLSGIFGGGSAGGTVPAHFNQGNGPPSFILHIYDFQVVVAPEETVLRGSAASYTVSIMLDQGSTNVNLPMIYLSVSGLPPGVIVSELSPTSGTAAGFSAVLMLQTGTSSPLGDFTFNVTGRDIRPLLGGSRVGTGRLHVYDFTVSSTPSQVDSTVGESAIFTENLKLVPGSSVTGIPSIELALAGLPAGSTSTISPATVTPTALGVQATLTIQPSTSGSFNLEITGTDARTPEGGSRTSAPLSPQTLIVSTPPAASALTDTSYCPFDIDSTTSGQQFGTVFTPSNGGGFKLVATNPGQFYLNVFFVGTPGSPLILHAKVPYPFVTRGSVPIQGFTAVGLTGPCYTPMNNVTSTLSIIAGATRTPSGASQILLSDYSAPTFGSTVTITITGPVPSTGLLYITLHLSYGLLKTEGYGTNHNDDATSIATGAIIIPNLQSYSFIITGHDSVGSQIDRTLTVQSENLFQKNLASLAGLVLTANTAELLESLHRDSL